VIASTPKTSWNCMEMKGVAFQNCLHKYKNLEKIDKNTSTRFFGEKKK
jgi:hypothetical protein